MNNKSSKTKHKIKTKSYTKSNKQFLEDKKTIQNINSALLNNSDLFSEGINNYPERKVNFSYIGRKHNTNRSILTEINKEKDYKKKITHLQKEIEKEKDISRLKTEESQKVAEINNKIMNCQKEIKLYATKNNKQREQLQLLSQEIGKKIDAINFNSIKKQIIKGNSEKKNEKETIDLCIEIKQKQLQNIVSLIEILETENDQLKKKIRRGKNLNKYYESLENQKNQENKINELKKEIKMKKTQLKEHMKCAGIRSELLKKIENIKDELEINYGKNSQIKKKLEDLEIKKKEKEKEEKRKKRECKPIIVANNNNNSINIYRNNNSSNLKFNSKTEENFNKNNKKVKNPFKHDKNKESEDDNLDNNEKKKEENKKEDNNNIETNNNDKNNLEKSAPKKVEQKRDSFNKILEEEMINIPLNVSEIFTEKELKAILIGLDKDKIKYNNLLKKINIDNIYIDTMETRHKLDIKNKLNKINELDERIEFLNMKRNENVAELQFYKKQIEEVAEIKKIYNMKVNKLSNQVEEKKKAVERKNQEIKLLKNQLIKLKKLIKNGDMKKIKNEPEIEIHYMDDEDEENNIIINQKEEENNKKTERDISTPNTEGTRYEENNENNVRNIKFKSDNFNLFYNKEEHISGNNSSYFSKNN